MVKLLIATAYEAIIDAGINPRNLKGSKTAVFTGSSFSESEKTIFCDNRSVRKFIITYKFKWYHTYYLNRTSFKRLI